MPEIQPLQALRYDLERTGGLQDVVAPPYDVIDAAQQPGWRRCRLERGRDRPPRGGEDRYERAAASDARLASAGVLVRDDEPALSTLEQDYTGPDGRRRTAAVSSRACASRSTAPDGSGRTSAPTRAPRGPLRLTRPRGPICRRSSPSTPTRTGSCAAPGRPHCVGRTIDAEGRQPARACAGSVCDRSRHRVLRLAELLIADGHHRYETAPCTRTRSAAKDRTATC